MEIIPKGREQSRFQDQDMQKYVYISKLGYANKCSYFNTRLCKKNVVGYAKKNVHQYRLTCTIQPSLPAVVGNTACQTFKISTDICKKPAYVYRTFPTENDFNYHILD